MTRTAFFIPVQDLLVEVEGLMRSQAVDHHPELGAALDHLLSSGGKRVRPAVALLFGEMLGASQEKMITLAAAIEMLHTATLVHDDLIDGALLRRGIPTLNSRWTPAATVLTGDFIFAQAARLASETESVEVMRIFSETLATIVNGEITQLFTSRGLASREDYFHRIYAKTASLFQTAAEAATLLTPVNEKYRNKARRFGYEIGMAFQIVDDILDFTGEQVTVGKPVANDLRQGLITLPALNYVEIHPNDPDMLAVLNGSRYDEGVFSRIIRSIRDSGAIQKSFDEANQFVDRGLQALESMPESIEKEALERLAGYIVQRSI
ncbi:MAG: polyprenyl synthetase family protein [Chloroflexi bacterium]|nr:MAG: polyprenyl synthetase family protein [Chloroflexota bacterium]